MAKRKQSAKQKAHQALLGSCARATKGQDLTRAQRNAKVKKCMADGGPKKKK